MVMGALERLDPPRVLGDLTLLATLGEGGMATVFLAGVGRGRLARMCAVKLLRANLPDHDYRTRFLDEARLVVRLHHNNIVDVREAGEIDGQLYIAMEAIAGRDLADIWDRCAEVGRAFPVSLAVHICREVLRGLHYAHTFPGLGLVHRDVSPSNLLIDWAGAVRLADFGLATSSLKASLTLPGVVFGKVGYMSPEQARHEGLDGRADVYAISVILWELLTGRPLRSPDGMTTDVVSRFEAPPPSTRSRRVDARLDEIVIRGLARDRDKRWPTADAMMRALSEWLAEHDPQMGQEKVAEFMRKLFGNAREVETTMRADLLRQLTATHVIAAHDARESSSETQVLEADGERQSRGSARSGQPSPTREQTELIDPGTVIAERYRVLSRLGRGGMGYVYLGEHVTVGRSVAIKVLTHEWSRTAAVAQRFRAEARAASAAGHPNIVEVFDAGELPDGRLYLVMEFLTGRNLFEEVQAVGPLPVARACHVMRDVGRAIRAAHEVSIIHRDLKPDNVMLVDRGRDEGELVKVLDFGISASARQEGEQRLTVVGQALGTPEYMAPEQARGREADERFDIYALGAMFHELLTGDPPFHGTNVFEIVSRKTSEDPPSVAEGRGGLPEALVQLVDDCLARAPERRPQSAQQFLGRLEDVLRSLPREPTEESQRIAFEASLTHGRPPADARQPDGAQNAEGAQVAAVAEVAEVAAEPRTGGQPQTGQHDEASGSPLVRFLAVAAVLLLLTAGVWFALERARKGEPDRDTVAAQAEAGDDELDEGETPDLARPPPDLAPALTSESAGDTTGGETETGTDGETGDGETGADSPQTPRLPRHKTAECRRIRAEAAAAERAWKWTEVVRLARKRSCWQRSNDARLLEVTALQELRRWDECTRVGEKGTGRKIKSIVEFCRKRASQG